MTQICSLLLAKMNGDDGTSNFIDSSEYNRQIINKNATISVTKSKFNGSSGFFNGNANLAINSGGWGITKEENFTIEAWVLFDTLPMVMGSGANAPVATIFSLNGGLKSLNIHARWMANPSNPTEEKMAFVCYYSDGVNSHTLYVIPHDAVVVDQWYHVSLTKSIVNNSVVLRVSGQTGLSSENKAAPHAYILLNSEDAPDYTMNSEAVVWMGGELDGEQVKNETTLSGYMADLRVIKKAIYPFDKEFDGDFLNFGGEGSTLNQPVNELANCVNQDDWYNLQDLAKPSICLCINDGLHLMRNPIPILYESEGLCMNQECPIPPVVCEMTITSATFTGCSEGNANFIIETNYPEYDAMLQMKIGSGNFEDIAKYNGSSANISIPIPSETITFRLYKYVCEDQRCFSGWPAIPYDLPAPLTPTVQLKSVRYDDGDLMKITGMTYKYVSPFYLPGSTPPLLGDYGEVYGGISTSSARDPKVGDVVKIEPEAGNNSVVSAVYRIVAIDNLTNEETRVITLECANYLCDDVKQNMVGWTIETIYVHNFTEAECVPGDDAGKPTTISVKVAPVTGKGNRFLFDNKYESPFFMTRGTYYRFDLSDPSNSTDSLGFSTSQDGSPDGPLTSAAIVSSGTPGTSGAYIDVFTKDLSQSSTPTIPFKADNSQEFYYYSTNNPSKGGKITMAVKSGNDSGDEDSDTAPTSAPCGGGHLCDRAKFDITINDVVVLNSNLNNGSDTTSKPSTKFGGNWSPLPSGVGNNQLDRRCVATITQEMNDQIFSSGLVDSDSDLGENGGCNCSAPVDGEEEPPTPPFVLGIKPSEGNLNPHYGVTWVRMKNKCSQTVYSCCIGLSFCPDCPPDQDC